METFLVDHLVENGVAPVNCTLEYGIIKLPGFPNLEILDRNVGALRLPLSMTDISDESRGWLFQHNRKQGFAIVNKIRIPSTDMETWYAEDSDWLPENDPILIEFGNGWRLPTFLEYQAIDKAMRWGMGKQAFASAMKIHEPGFYYTHYNKMYSQGTNGRLWVSNQYNSEHAWQLVVMPGSVTMNYMPKWMGGSLRAVRDAA